VDADQVAWLLSHVGVDADMADLAARFARLGRVRAVALEVLRERHAALLADPLRVTVSGVVTVDNVENLRALERQLAAVESGDAPDVAEPSGHELVVSVMVPARRYR